MNFQKMIEELPNNLVTGLVVGISTSAIWAFLVWLHNRRRSWVIEKSIREIQPGKMCFHADGSAGIELSNNTLTPIVVRSVELRGGENDSFVVHLSLHKESSQKCIHEDQRGWVELPAKTHANWHFTVKRDELTFFTTFLPVKAIVATVEYKTILGTTRIVEIESKRDWMLKGFEDLLSGNHQHFEQAMEQRRKLQGAV